jgi:hypothetical protein
MWRENGIIKMDTLLVDHESSLDAWLEGLGLLHPTIRSRNVLDYPYSALVQLKIGGRR